MPIADPAPVTMPLAAPVVLWPREVTDPTMGDAVLLVAFNTLPAPDVVELTVLPAVPVTEPSSAPVLPSSDGLGLAASAQECVSC